MSESLTATAIIAAITDLLGRNGYQRIALSQPQWDTPSSRLFEDSYNVVGVVAYETCDELVRAWANAQGSLVELMSQYLGKGEAKAWDGYLVLITPDPSSSRMVDLEMIRYNTARLRKLVATGSDMTTTADIERVLRPLLPLTGGDTGVGPKTVIDLLPQVLAGADIPASTTKLLIDAFRAQAPLMESLHGGAIKT